ncbi:MAG: GGDEF domain-containing protein [Desulfuromonadaceae bacterium]|nr:GGDEF domain-containing protein [Desulfuromonadaceae bacterium]
MLERLALKVSLCLSNVTAHERLKQLANLDPLTRLLNRRVLDAALQREFQRARRYDTALSVVFIDMNDFKRVNDRYGHETGDRLLCHVAMALREESRATDLAARYAGDEFVLILPETREGEACQLVERILSRLVAQPLVFEDEAIVASLCYGVAALPASDASSAQALLKQADSALYLRKRQFHDKKGFRHAD